jgi:vacuolar-type H+-ATPase subunit I/STV1
MFGDIGHGLIMLLFAAYMIRNEREFLRVDSNSEV